MSIKRLLLLISLSIAVSLSPTTASANTPGGGTGQGPDVTVQDNQDGTVTMANGIVSIVIVKATSRLNEVTYTYSNTGTVQTSPMLLGKGQYYYGGYRGFVPIETLVMGRKDYDPAAEVVKVLTAMREAIAGLK